MPVTGPSLEPLLAGTLVLMSAFQKDDPCPHMVGKITANLERLAADPRLSDPFRAVIRRLSLQWLGREAEGALAIAALSPTPLQPAAIH